MFSWIPNPDPVLSPDFKRMTLKCVSFSIVTHKANQVFCRDVHHFKLIQDFEIGIFWNTELIVPEWNIKNSCLNHPSFFAKKNPCKISPMVMWHGDMVLDLQKWQSPSHLDPPGGQAAGFIPGFPMGFWDDENDHHDPKASGQILETLNQGYINGIPTVLWFFLPPGRFLVWYLDTCRTHRNHHFPGSFVNSTTFPPAMSTPFRLHLKSGENFVVGPQKIPLALNRVEKWRLSVGWWRLPLGCWTSFIQTKTQPTKLGDVFARHRAWRIVQSLERCRNHSPRSPVTSNHQDILTNVLRTKIILRNQPLTFYDPKPFSSAYHLQSRLMWTHVLLIQNFEVYVILVSISTYVHLSTQASFEKTHRPSMTDI